MSNFSSPHSVENDSSKHSELSRRSQNEPEWETQPDLYGIRRSGRARTKTAPFQIPTEQKLPKQTLMKQGRTSAMSKSSDESGSEYDSSDSECLIRTAKREKNARKKVKKERKSKSRDRHRKKESRTSGGKTKKSKKHKKIVQDKRKSHLSSDSDAEDDHDDLDDDSSHNSSDDRRISNRRRANKIKSYREDDAYADFSDSDEEDEAAADSNQFIDFENTDGIDKVLDYRTDKKGRTGHLTTLYSNEEPTVDESNELEEQYLIKWQSWSHFHNTWESLSSLETQKVRGMRKLEIYIKRLREYDEWRETAEPESRELAVYQLDMQRTLNEEYTKAERVVDKRKDKCGQLEYYVKWRGLPYAECTWEAADLMERYFMTEILAYEERHASKKLPMSIPSNRGLKFQPFSEQPDYIGGGNGLVLRDYQVTGLNWLAASWCSGRSCILADEMGLGKTIQTISFLSYLFNDYHKVYGPYLIVVPLSTLPAWLREFDAWAKDINVVPYIGDMKSREIIRSVEWTQKNRRLKFNAIVTTYEILMKDSIYLQNIQWAVLAVDEAHRLKNDESLLYRNLIEFSTQHRLLITGTPLQNSLRELWALLHFIEPLKFDSWAEFEENNQPCAGKIEGYSKLHKTIKPYLLRRLKKEVEKSLPAKVEQILRVDMSKIQKQYYKWILTRNFEALNKGLKGSSNSLLNIVCELKKCCNHPWLIRPLDPSDEPSDKEKLQLIVKGGGKLWLLDKLLVRLYETKHRVLIFSQMVMMLDILAEYLSLKNFSFQRLDGTINNEQRKQALDSFNAENSRDFCFLLSTRAGGLGINLATADTVIIFDSDWNPQNDIQAQSRAHRIGQTKQVNIYRLVTKFSVEEDIIERAKKKMVLDHLVIQRMDTSGRTVISDKPESKNPFNKEELNTILKFGAEELFKEVDGEEQDLLDFDIEDFLQRAETREESDQPQTAGEELLAGFKVANFNYDEDEDNEDETETESAGKNWGEIIPVETRQKIEAEENAKAQSEMFLAPRQRTKVKSFQINFSKTSKDDRSSSSESESEDDTTLGAISNATGGGSTSAGGRARSGGRKATSEFRHWTDAEIRAFVKSFKKYPNAESRLEAVADDAELHEKSLSDLKNLLVKLKSNCDAAVDEANKENAGVKTSKYASFKMKGVVINATQFLKSQEDFEPLVKTISILDSPYNYKLPYRKRRLPNWDVIWESENDDSLLIGVYLYGSDNWDAIKNDERLQLQDKMILDSDRKPQAKHLHTRLEYLLRLLDLQVNPRKSGKSPEKHKDDKAAARAAKKKRKQLEKAEKKQKRQEVHDSRLSKKVFKSVEEVNTDSSSDDAVDEGSEEGEVKIRNRSKNNDSVSHSLASPLKPIKFHHSDQPNSIFTSSHHSSLSIDAKTTHQSTSPAISPNSGGRTALLNDLSVSVDSLNVKSPEFKTCKEQMRSVRKFLQKLTEVGHEEESEETLNRRSLARIGDRIIEIIKGENSNEKAGDKKSQLWNFVAHFSSKYNAESLHSFYQKLEKKRHRTEQHQNTTKHHRISHHPPPVGSDDNERAGKAPAAKKMKENRSEKACNRTTGKIPSSRLSLFNKPRQKLSPPPEANTIVNHPRKRMFDPSFSRAAPSQRSNVDHPDYLSRNVGHPHHDRHDGGGGHYPHQYMNDQKDSDHMENRRECTMTTDDDHVVDHQRQGEYKKTNYGRRGDKGDYHSHGGDLAVHRDERNRVYTENKPHLKREVDDYSRHGYSGEISAKSRHTFRADRDPRTSRLEKLQVSSHQRSKAPRLDRKYDLENDQHYTFAGDQFRRDAERHVGKQPILYEDLPNPSLLSRSNDLRDRAYSQDRIHHLNLPTLEPPSVNMYNDALHGAISIDLDTPKSAEVVHYDEKVFHSNSESISSWRYHPVDNVYAGSQFVDSPHNAPLPPLPYKRESP